MNIIINTYIDSIQNATSMTNLEMKLKNILSRNFMYNIYGIYGNISGRKSSFSRIMYNRLNIYQDKSPKISIKDNIVTITFKHNKNKISQFLYLEEYKITEVNEKSTDLKKKTGGKGISYYLDIKSNHLNVLPLYRENTEYYK